MRSTDGVALYITRELIVLFLLVKPKGHLREISSDYVCDLFATVQENNL